MWCEDPRWGHSHDDGVKQELCRAKLRPQSNLIAWELKPVPRFSAAVNNYVLLHRLLSSWVQFPRLIERSCDLMKYLIQVKIIMINSYYHREILGRNCIEWGPLLIQYACSVLNNCSWGVDQVLRGPQGLWQHQQVSREKSTQVAPTCADQRETIIQQPPEPISGSGHYASY